MLKGVDVILYEKTPNGTDPFGKQLYKTTPVTVKNVLVGYVNANDITTSTDLQGKSASYMIGIPKGDTHEWEDSVVEALGHKWKTSGFIIEAQEELVPTKWHKKIAIERYE